MSTIKRLLIANRGEIAVRIVRACRELGIAPMAVYSDADAASLHVCMADEAYRLGPAAPRESYLSIERLLDVARQAGAEAIHPGYGFLAENAAFAEAVIGAGIRWIGPAPAVIRALGTKTAARELAQRANVPIVPGTTTPIRSAAEATTIAQRIGYPVLLKAAAGGGGKGMRAVARVEEMDTAFALAQGEARSAFGDDALYLEKLIVAPHHVEIQILGDEHGHVIHLGERECSIQRRHQKLVEETPSPFLRDDVRQAMGEAAVRLATTAGYTNAGTVEFLVDAEQQFYFLEVNTRLQVEHPITELVTGIDLVQAQLAIAMGQPLRWTQDAIRPRGHAIECRICAEDPARQFVPCPGEIVATEWPGGPNVRWDGGVYSGWRIPMEYDSLLGKLCVWGETRAQAIARIQRALAEIQLVGVTTNREFHQLVLADPRFQSGRYATDFLNTPLATEPYPPTDDVWIAAALAQQFAQRPIAAQATTSCWQQTARRESVHSADPADLLRAVAKPRLAVGRGGE